MSLRNLLFSFYKINIVNNTNRYFDINYLGDYIRIVVDLKGKIKFNLNIKSVNKLIECHNEALNIYMKKMFRGKNQYLISKDSKFNSLKLPKEFELIETEQRLYQEGSEQYNCVYSRIDYILKGKCVIYSLLKNNNRYTIEFKIRKNKYYISEIKGKYNQIVDVEIVNYVNQFIK